MWTESYHRRFFPHLIENYFHDWSNFFLPSIWSQKLYVKFLIFFFRLACAILQLNHVRDAVEWISIPLALSCNLKKCFQVNKPFIFFMKMCDIFNDFFVKLCKIFTNNLQYFQMGHPVKQDFVIKVFVSQPWQISLYVFGDFLKISISAR